MIVEGKNHKVIVVDVQPAYSSHSNGVFENCINFVNNQTGDVLMYVNAEQDGLTEDTIDSIKQYWEQVVYDSHAGNDSYSDDDNEYESSINWNRFEIIDKGYGHFRSYMDNNISDSTIIKIIRYMYLNDYNDIRDAFEDNYDALVDLIGTEWDDWMPHESFFIKWISVAKLKEFSGAYIVGGARNECLREVELLMNAFNIPYKRVDSLIYEGKMYKINLNENDLALLLEDPLHMLYANGIDDELTNAYKKFKYVTKTEGADAAEKIEKETRAWFIKHIRDTYAGRKLPAKPASLITKCERAPSTVFWREVLDIPNWNSKLATDLPVIDTELGKRKSADDAAAHTGDFGMNPSRGYGADKYSRDSTQTAGQRPSEEFGNRKHSAGIHEYEPIDADFTSKLSDVEFLEWLRKESASAKSDGTVSPLLALPEDDNIGNKMANKLIDIYAKLHKGDTRKATQIVRLMYNNGKKNKEFKQFNNAYKKYIGELPLYGGEEYSSEYNHKISNEGVNYMLSKDIFNSLINEADDIEVNIDADDVGDLSVEDEIAPANDHSVGEDDSSYFVQLANDIMMSDDRYSMNTLQTVWEKKGILAIEHIYSKVVGDLPNKEQVQSPEIVQPEQEPEIQDDELSRLVKLSR